MGETNDAQQQQRALPGTPSGVGGVSRLGAGAGAGGGGGDEGGGGAGGANFDVVTAIRVLKSAGHADHAAELARRHGGEDLCGVGWRGAGGHPQSKP